MMAGRSPRARVSPVSANCENFGLPRLIKLHVHANRTMVWLSKNQRLVLFRMCDSTTELTGLFRSQQPAGSDLHALNAKVS
jgi:hypothetical protein